MYVYLMSISHFTFFIFKYSQSIFLFELIPFPFAFRLSFSFAFWAQRYVLPLKAISGRGKGLLQSAGRGGEGLVVVARAAN